MAGRAMTPFHSYPTAHLSPDLCTPYNRKVYHAFATCQGAARVLGKKFL
jgi:hypothetical protein